MNLQSQSKRPTKKLQERYIGPYKILAVVSPVAYKLELPETMKVHPTFHVSLLKEYHPNKEDLFPGRIIPPPPPVIINNEEEYEVEQILDKRIRQYGKSAKTQYLVKWKGYPEYDATWEPEANLKNAQEKIQDYLTLIVDNQA